MNDSDLSALPDKSLADLEWGALADEIATRCSSAAAEERARGLRPFDVLADAQRRVREVSQAIRADALTTPVPVGPVPDLGDVLERVERGGVATAPELHLLRVVLRTASTVRVWSHAHREQFPDLATALASEAALDRLRDALDHAIEADGGIADRASHDLGTARRRAGELRHRLIGRLEELIARYADVLQDRYYTLRDGRYVLPVRSDSHVKVPGIVLGSSASGATLFIEPRAVLSLGNQLKVAMADVEREEARVLAELSERAQRFVEPIRVARNSCVHADLLSAVVRVASEMNAVPLEPVAERTLDLRAMRHPLLALRGEPVVANDLILRGGTALVLSGPNAGGKTVALKCLGLAALMARAGLPVPAAESSVVGWFDSVLTDVGDDQSLARSLSTFSAHVTNLGRMLKVVGAGSLVLLDELAGGTDPEEGAALAAAVLDVLTASGAAVAVTTHYELLKTLPVRDPRFVNASVGFDREEMRPTFAVTLGIPGASSALLVAARFGIPQATVDRARSYLPDHATQREDVLRRLEDERIAATMARAAAEDQLHEAESLRVRLDGELTASRAREAQKVGDETRRVLDALRRAREELHAASARVRRSKATEEDIRAAERQIGAVAQQVAVGGPLALQPVVNVNRRLAREDEIEPGLRVYVRRLAATADVIERPARGQVRVAAGAMKLYVPLEELSIEDGAVETRSGAHGKSVATTSDATGATPSLDTMRGTAALPLVRASTNTCDVRGLRADDALSLIESFLDRIFGANESGGFVLHGHGTGALRTAARSHLDASQYVASWRAADPEDGGDALTVFWLKT